MTRSLVQVDSEVGRLRRVLVHEPGPEVDQMVPAMMEELLFDDILHGAFARDEHRRFRRILELLGVQVLEARDLLAETLALPAARGWVEEVIFPHLLRDFRHRLSVASPSELAAALVGGLRREGVDTAWTLDELFGVRPLPNWCFQRDTQVVLGRGVVFSSMANPARVREALLSRAIFRFHPDLAEVPVLHDPTGWEGPDPPPALEGGDVLVLSRDVLAVGSSERTTPGGIQALIEDLVQAAEGPRWLLQVELPRERAFMHLDTLFTPVDRGAALVFSPVLLPQAGGRAEVLEYDLHGSDRRPRSVGSLLPALARRGLEMEPILCGGDDVMDQQREQWTDGANALALAPGKIILYDRNVRTAEALERAGFRVVRADDLLLGAADVSLEDEERVCILTPSNELSRARGGPHCLTHPLLRDPV